MAKNSLHSVMESIFHKKFFYVIWCFGIAFLIFRENQMLISRSPFFEGPGIYKEFPAVSLNSRDSFGSEVECKEKNSKPIMYKGSQERWSQPAFPLRQNYILKFELKDFNKNTHGAEKSSPIADEHGVVFASDDGIIKSLDYSGREMWSIKSVGANKGIHSTAAVTDCVVYYGDYLGQFFSLDRKTGAVKWMKIVGETLGASPLVVGDFIFLSVEMNDPVNGYLMKLDRHSGNTVWVSDLYGEQGHASPILSSNGEVIFTGANNSQFSAWSSRDGRLLWSHKATSPIKSTGFTYEKLVVFSDMEGTVWALDVASGNVVWQLKLDVVARSSPSLSRSGKWFVIADYKKIYIIGIDGKLLASKVHNYPRSISSPVIVIDGDSGNELILFPCEGSWLCSWTTEGLMSKKLFRFDGVMSSIPFLHQDWLFLTVREGSALAFKSIGP